MLVLEIQIPSETRKGLKGKLVHFSRNLLQSYKEFEFFQTSLKALFGYTIVVTSIHIIEVD